MRAAVMAVDAPQVSVMPQASSMGKPKDKYHLISAGEIGAAPVSNSRARWIPMSFRTLLSTNQRATVNWHFKVQETGCCANTRLAICSPTPMPQA